MQVGITSPNVINTIDLILPKMKETKNNREYVEHLMYILFKRIKRVYRTYTYGSENSFIIESYIKHNNLPLKLNKSFEYDSFINDLIESLDSIDSRESLLNFLENYFIFTYKNSIKELDDFYDRYFSLVSKLINSDDMHLKQTTYIQDQKRAIKVRDYCSNVFNDDNFFLDSVSMKNARTITVKFKYLEEIDIDFIDDYVKSIKNTEKKLNKFLNNFKRKLLEKHPTLYKAAKVNNELNEKPKCILFADYDFYPPYYQSRLSNKDDVLVDCITKQLSNNNLSVVRNNYLNETIRSNKLSISQDIDLSLDLYLSFLDECFKNNKN